MIEFPCPHCSSRLRLQDRSLRGRTVNCPDCQKLILIEDAPEGLRGVPAQAAAPTAVEQSKPVRQTKFRITPQILIWVSAGICFLAVVTWSLRSGKKHGPAEPLANVEPDLQAAPDRPQGKVEQTVAATAESRLAALGLSLKDYIQRSGKFPEPTDKLSWLGQVQRQRPEVPAFHADAGWEAEVNDAFVRRRLEEYQNPVVQSLVGEGGYPATHFAGVAGVGQDAASLPVEHPRAGIFGLNRFTTRDDVKDGLANTLMVVGVTQRLGSWAAPGTATLRSLTEEPYINGPDSLGTGQPDGMHVLMADGSVRFLSANTDPVIMRRMAAMADGLPLDPNVGGDPLAMEPNVVPQAPALVQQDPPIQVELAPEPPPFNVAKALSQKLIRFEQTRPLTLKSLLIQWSEMAALPVDISQVSEEILNQEQNHTLDNIDLRTLMEHLIAPAGLQAIYDDRFGVRLQPR